MKKAKNAVLLFKLYMSRIPREEFLVTIYALYDILARNMHNTPISD